jgi:NADPH:quinone reductase-like Zn-dependent oxidoreductase/NAD(P)-dependent dehydrogenase (short-subunit alcohol dehydrogenase family)
MLATGLSESAASVYLDNVPDGRIKIACVNSPSSVTLSGDADMIDELERQIIADGSFARKLRVKTAYHSEHMKVIAQDFLKAMGDVKKQLANSGSGTVMFSSVTGHEIDPAQLTAEYWVNNMCGRVLFSQALGNVLQSSMPRAGGGRGQVRWSAVLEIGSHGALESPIGQIIQAIPIKALQSIQYASMLTRGQDAQFTALNAAGKLWSTGHSMDFLRINHEDEDRSQLQHLPELPAYPWNHSKGYWHETSTTRSIRFPPSGRNDSLGMPVDNQNPMEPRWQNKLKISEIPWIEQHQITGTTLYPAAGMLIMVLEAARQIVGAEVRLRGIAFKDVMFERGLVISSGDSGTETSLSLRPLNSVASSYSFTVFSVSTQGKWTRHCFGEFSIIYDEHFGDVQNEDVAKLQWMHHAAVLKEIQLSSTMKIDTRSFYQDLQGIGMEYGEAFQNVVEAAAGPGSHKSHGTIKIPNTRSAMPYNFEYPHIIHPATLDSIFHLMFVAFNDGRAMKEAMVPYSIEHMFINFDQPHGSDQRYTGYAQRTRQQGREAAGDLVISDQSFSEAKLVIRNFTLRQVTSGGAQSATHSMDVTLHRPTQRSVRLDWKGDIDFWPKLNSFDGSFENSEIETSATAPLHTWLDRFCHKRAGGRALFVVDGSNSDELLHTLESFSPKQALPRRLGECTLAALSEPAFRSLLDLNLTEIGLEVKILPWSTSQITTQLLKAKKYDVAIIYASSYEAETLSDTVLPIRDHVKPGGYVCYTGPRSENQFRHFDVELNDSLIKEDLEPKVSRGETRNSTFAAVKVPAPMSRALNIMTTTLLVPNQASEGLLQVADSISAYLSKDGVDIRLRRLSTVGHIEETASVISLLEIEQPFIKHWSESEYYSFKRLVSTCARVLWITRNGQPLIRSNPDFAPATGLLRVIRNEFPQLKLAHLDLSSEPIQTAQLIARLWLSCITGQTQDAEFAEVAGDIYIPRAVEDSSFDMEIELASGKPISFMGELGGKVCARLEGPDTRQQYSFVQNSASSLPIGSEEVEIRVHAICLGAKSLGSASEMLSSEISSEAVGTITKIGLSVTQFVLGQQAIMVQRQACSTHLRQHQDLVVGLPSSMSANAAVTLPRVFGAAWYALVDVAKLTVGQKVLIESAASDLGQAAVITAQYLGAEIFATVSTQEMKTLLVDRYKIPGERIFDSQSADYASGVLHATRGNGVDVVFQTHADAKTAAHCSFVAEFGTFVDLSGKLDTSLLTKPLFARNATLAAINMDRIWRSRPEQTIRLLNHVMSLVSAKILHEVGPIQAYPISALHAALERLYSRNHYGSIVLTFDQGALVPMLLPGTTQTALDPHGTYILSGGLGMLGIDIARDMITNGARHIVFLSRSGGSKSRSTLESLRNHILGVVARVEAYRCDVCNAEEVQAVIEKLLVQDGCKIKGLVQCAMVLDDGIFENMPFEQWQRATSPKILGSWNLHNALPKDLDFFIMLSSVTCVIGNASQANYAAGNTYEDALAWYRRGQGLNASAIDVGLVSDSAEGIVDRFDRLEGLTTTKSELMVIIRAMMRGMTTDGVPTPPQVVLGMGHDVPPESRAARTWAADAKFVHLLRQSTLGHGDSGMNGVATDAKHEMTKRDALANTKTLQEAVAIVRDFLIHEAASAAGISPQDINPDKPLFEFGGKHD